MRTISCTLQSQRIEMSQQQHNLLPQCQLQWRQGQLLVRLVQDFQQLYLPSLERKQGLVQCLKNSPVRLVRLDPSLGEEALQRWADACAQAKKPAFLLRQGTVGQKLRKKPNRLTWAVMRIIDRIAALLLLIGLSPVMLALIVLMYAYSSRTIFSHTWQIGLRGKLFKALKFDTTQGNNHARSKQLGRWMRKYRLDEIPQLLNVLRGEMSLFGPRPLTLSEVVRPDPKEQQHLNVLSWIKLLVNLLLKPDQGRKELQG